MQTCSEACGRSSGKSTASFLLPFCHVFVFVSVWDKYGCILERARNWTITEISAYDYCDGALLLKNRAYPLKCFVRTRPEKAISWVCQQCKLHAESAWFEATYITLVKIGIEAHKIRSPAFNPFPSTFLSTACTIDCLCRGNTTRVSWWHWSWVCFGAHSDCIDQFHYGSWTGGIKNGL